MSESGTLIVTKSLDDPSDEELLLGLSRREPLRSSGLDRLSSFNRSIRPSSAMTTGGRVGDNNGGSLSLVAGRDGGGGGGDFGLLDDVDDEAKLAMSALALSVLARWLLALVVVVWCLLESCRSGLTRLDSSLRCGLSRSLSRASSLLLSRS